MFNSLTFAIATLLIASAFPIPSQAQDGSQLAAKGLSFFQKRKYAEAYKLLSAAVKTRSADPSLQYYLGVSALYSNNQAVAKTALSRCVVLSIPKNPFHKQSLALLNQYFRVQPYNCRATALNSHSWSKKAMPIRIYVSDGKMLPKDFRTENITGPQVKQVTNWAKNPSFVSRLETCPGFRGSHKQAIMSATQWWSWATSEGILSFQFVQAASNADILVFFIPCPSTREISGFTAANSIPKDATVMQLKLPVETLSSEDEKDFKHTVAHEFGHAWGLYHSEDKADLMYPHGNEESNGITENDKQSLRALYAGTNELTHVSVGK